MENPNEIASEIPVKKPDRRSITSRLNGQKSKGPKTPEGKARSARNATTHGLFARAVVLDGESADSFNRLLLDLSAEYDPQSPTESALVETMAAAWWRKNRLILIEKANLDREIRSQQGDLALDSQPIRAGFAFSSLCNRGRSLDIINRYEARYNREFARAVQRLLDVRQRRRAEVREASDQTVPGPKDVF